MTEDIIPRLKGLLERMANECSAPMDLWDEFSNGVLALIARLEAAEKEVERLKERNVEVSMLAHKWMVAHDCLQAGKPYEFPRPADVPEAIARAEAAESALAASKAREEALVKGLTDAAASLVAAISLLKNGGRKAAPSNRMFEQMIVDYEASLDRARALLSSSKAGAQPNTGDADNG